MAAGTFAVASGSAAYCAITTARRRRGDGVFGHYGLGVSLMEYLTRFRFEVARHLLTVTDLTIDQIAGEAGFSNASHLSRVFLGHSGRRPGDYRHRVRIGGMWPPPRMLRSPRTYI